MLLCRDNLHGLLSAFFGADGRGQLSKEAFRAFVLELRDELLRLEFEWYDWRRQGAISGRDFAHSIVSCARLKHVDAYLDKCQVGGGVDVGVGGVGGWGGWGWWWGWGWGGGDEGGVWRGAWWWLVSEGGWVAGRRVTLVELAPILSPPPPPSWTPPPCASPARPCQRSLPACGCRLKSSDSFGTCGGSCACCRVRLGGWGCASQAADGSCAAVV